MILFEKYGQHQPLNRQSEREAREGVDLSLSTLADLVGACTTVLQPLHRPDRGTCAPCRAPARRRHACTDPGEGQDDRRDTSGPMSATTAPSAAGRRRRRCIMPHATGGTNILYGICAASPASCRPMPTTVTMSCTIRYTRGRTGHIGAVLGPCQEHVLRTGGHRRQCKARQECGSRSRRSRWEAVKRIDALFEIDYARINGVAATERLNIRKEQVIRN